MVEIALQDRASRAPDFIRVDAAGGEVELAVALAEDRIRISGALRLTRRAIARGAKRSFQRDKWIHGRAQLLLRHAFEHPVMMALDLRHGYFSLHASTVERGGRSLMLLGTNGAGKTTTAAGLVRHHGFRLLTDNFAPCNGKTVLSFPGPPRMTHPGFATSSQSSLQPATVDVGVICFLEEGADLALLSRDVALDRLVRYVNREREDHRDSGLCAAVRGRWGGESHAGAVVERLAGCRIATFDWRRHGLQEIAGL